MIKGSSSFNYFLAAVDCQWNGWGDWSPCSVTCGQGKQTRRRSKSTAKYGGAGCDSESSDTEVCNRGSCRKFYRQLVFIGTLPMETLGHCQADIFIAPFFAAVDCQWSGWGDWSPCSVTCGQGKLTRERSKTPAKDGGAECDGESLDTEVCNQGSCRKCYKQIVVIGTLPS